MAFYKYSWAMKSDKYKNSTEKGIINTEPVKSFIETDIKEEDKKYKKNEVDEEVLLLAVKHFIDTSFKKDSDINKMGFERAGAIGGDEGYNYPRLITNMATDNYMDIPNQRFIEVPSLGAEKTVPLSFYFDMSGSMYEYTDLLAKMCFLLLKNNISIIYGYNEFISGVIYADDDIKSFEELKEALIHNDYNHHIEVGDSHRTLSEFLQSKKAEKCVVFSDFDPYLAVCSLSKHCKVYWFCFEDRYNYPKYDFREFKGNAYYTQNFDDIRNHFIHMDSYDYVENQKSLILSKTGRGRKNGRN